MNQFGQSIAKISVIHSYMDSATFEDRDVAGIDIHMNRLHIGDAGSVVAIFVVSVDSKVW